MRIVPRAGRDVGDRGRRLAEGVEGREQEQRPDDAR
jgi:hypothetical protein